MNTGIIGARIRARREELGFKQETFAHMLGFNDRQTLSAIENSERRVSADELLKASELLAVPVDFFTDPFRLVGEGGFNWRQSRVPPHVLDGYEASAGRLIALYRALGRDLGRRPPLLRRALGLTKASSFEDAGAAGERFAEEFGLLPVPALKLATVMERDLGILVLHVDPVDGVSGAACRLPELDAVLINRNEVPGRRNYDLAHELFHILTWDVMPPERVEDTTTTGRSRVEQLADNFASALLMPRSALVEAGGSVGWDGLVGNSLTAMMNAVADRLGITSVALKWRLVSTGLLSRGRLRDIDDAELRNNGRSLNDPMVARDRTERPALYSRPFVELIAEAMEQGVISVRRVASLLDIAIDDLEAVFAAHGVTTDVGI
jgi:Zn-dependent peptidase ImmA (M78 family)/DNA-binding XRE family transcriptional regulator